MKYIAQTLLFNFLVCGTCFAQVTISATANGTFSTLGSSTVTKLADLNFGDFDPGLIITVNPKSSQAAEFLFNGNSNTIVQVTLTYPSVLTYGSNTINFQMTPPIYNTIPDAMTAVQFKTAIGYSASTGSDGNLYVWTGGKVTAAQNQVAGTYTGIIKFSAVQQ